MKKNTAVDLTSGALPGKIMLFTIPIIISGTLQLLFNAVDMVVVGRYCGSSSLAAVGATGSVTNLIIGLFMGLSVSSGILISHAVGGNQKKEIDQILHTAVISSIALGTIIGIVGIVLCRNLLTIMNTPVDVIDKATLYMRIVFLGMPFNMLYNFSESMLRSTGDSVRPLIYLTIASIVHVILNIVLVTFFNLDVAGVAIATVASQALSVFLIIRRLIKGTDHLKLRRSEMKFSMPHFIRLMKIGIPAGLQGTMFAMANTIIQSAINSFGTSAIAGNSAASSIEGFLNTAMVAFGQASITAAGQNMGAGKFSRIKHSTVVCVIFAAAFSVVLGFFTRTFAPQLLEIYCPGDPKVIEVGQIRLNLTATFYMFVGSMEVLAGAIRGMGHSFTPMLVSVTGLCGFRILWIYTVFERIRTMQCLYTAYVIPWIVISVIDVILLAVFIKKHKKASQTVTVG